MMNSSSSSLTLITGGCFGCYQSFNTSKNGLHPKASKRQAGRSRGGSKWRGASPLNQPGPGFQPRHASTPSHHDGSMHDKRACKVCQSQPTKLVKNDLEEAVHEWVRLTADIMARVKNDLGCKLASRGRKEEALEAWQEAATAGNAKAHYNIAVLYHKGQHSDMAKAMDHYRKASHLGHGPAMSTLSLINDTNSPTYRRNAANYSFTRDTKPQQFPASSFKDGWRVSRELLKEAQELGVMDAASLEQHVGYTDGTQFDGTRLRVIEAEVQSRKEGGKTSLHENSEDPAKTGCPPLSWRPPQDRPASLGKRRLDPPRGVHRLPSHFNQGILEDYDEGMLPHYGICDKQQMIAQLIALPFTGEGDRLTELNIFNVFGSFPIRCNFAIFEDEHLDY